jgi:CRP/FNR family cyclic AMP-dependent transcriptional regulator
MKERFQGREGRAALLNALRAQFLVDGKSEAADMIASAVIIKEFAPGESIFVQGERGSDLCFILAGQVSVSLNGQQIATVSAGMHVGEIALLEPFKGRSTTVAAIDTVVVAQIPTQKFYDTAEHHPDLWRRMALELAHRLVKAQAA